MLNELIHNISDNVSKKNIKNVLLELEDFHRIQASPGYRSAASFCLNQMKSYDMQAEIIEYPAREDVKYYETQSFQEWNCLSAVCDMVYPFDLELADYKKDPISIIQRSLPTSFESKGIEVVYLDKGNDENQYKDVDLNGKIIFVRDAMESYLDWAVDKKGAIGIITDYVVEQPGVSDRKKLSEARRYTSFWWNLGVKRDIFGFVLTPAIGDKFAEICLSQRAKNDVVLVKGHVESNLYDGSIENVTAYVEGKSKEEILIVSHLCHPSKSANDNLSGVSASIEAMRTLDSMIRDGLLEKPEKSIRMILVPEMTGTVAYLSSLKSTKHILAGIDLDMVGGRQVGGYGPLQLCGVPHSTPSFVAELGTIILEKMKAERNFLTKAVPFGLGSDHMILSDPTIGIPCPMLGQYPDVFYHTSKDTDVIIDYELIKTSAIFAATYVYTLATLDISTVNGILTQLILSYLTDLSNNLLEYNKNNISEIDFKSSCSHLRKFYYNSALDINRFISKRDFNSHSKIDRFTERIDMLYKAFVLSDELEYEMTDGKENKSIPVRLYKAPMTGIEQRYSSIKGLKQDDKKCQQKLAECFDDVFYAKVLISYYINGERTVDDIYNDVYCVMHQGKKSAVESYIKLLCKAGLVEYKK